MVVLRAVARACDKVIIQFTAPTDEVGNELVDRIKYLTGEINSSNIKEYAELFKHPFTGVNYVQYYREIVESEGAIFEYHISNDLSLVQGQNVLVCNVHDRDIIKDAMKKNNLKVFTLQEICHLRNRWGLLGCNKVSEEIVKLFPSMSQTFVEELQDWLESHFHVRPHCMIYGDGGFKCPVCRVWEELDPVISPGFTSGLNKVPSEIKLKYLADNKFSELSGEKLIEELKKKEIVSKSSDLTGSMTSQGTTPRQIPDLLGSPADLTSGSGDKGTPVVWIKNYFSNYASE